MQCAVRVACAVGLVHFSIAALLWLLAAVGAVLMAIRFGAAHVSWSSFLQSLPVLAFLAAFYFAFRASRQRPQLAATGCAALFLAAGALFSYDTAHDRYQMQSLSVPGGCSHFYITWFWWAYDR